MFSCWFFCCFVVVERSLLALFLLGVAFLASLAFFGSLDAALMGAFLACRFGLFAAGFSASNAHADEERHSADHRGECLYRLHVSFVSTGRHAQTVLCFL